MNDNPSIIHDIPLISVIIPAYNCQDYIEQCIQSVRNQTLIDLEIICVNDGSTDRTSEILRDIATHDCRIRVIDQDNKGEGAARNTGLDIARGCFLLFVDADDFLEPDMLKKMTDAALKGSGNTKHSGDQSVSNAPNQDEQVNSSAHRDRQTASDPSAGSEPTDSTPSHGELTKTAHSPNTPHNSPDICDIVICGVSSYNTQTGQSTLIPWGCMWREFPYGAFSASDNPDMIFHSFQNWTWNKLFSAEFIRSQGLRFDEIQRSADLFFVMCALATAKTIRVVPQQLYHYRTNNPSSNIETSDRAPLDFYQSFIRVRDWLVERDAFDPIKKGFNNWVIGSIFFNFTILKSWHSFCELFDYLRADDNAALKELGLLDVPKADYFNERDWRKMEKLISANDAQEFLFALWRESCATVEELNNTICAYEETENSINSSAKQLLLAAARSARAGLYSFRSK